ncbi:metal ABC transporter ATP-binding protein [Bacillus toyonensis]|jgi:zinc transport system ATP-binding protein|uniref:Zinc ABC transporter ATP-binding protein n=1 Tax=Bacillus toyonensis TaxID=155322 RepID=A0A1X3MQ55_9BACI|nr:MULTISPECIES: metal ABC transporter ATP-binding protein [Bacillus cereus group]AFU14995.1 Zinc uptake system ATP-binding protein zurA [Bacillus thuringiensis MC28]EEL32706.1 Zinc uptake system ATP-binding protein zurA [Bacillus cereus Rock3-28]OTX08300.1 zinc ABC transporter ATP-binding protein [Bacillus thuringiensis serovar seoulensis]QPW46884.1 metal ABC transporter ATP-binding protein [Bacillus thuringiensis]MBJ7948810.1 metal ABC transporter ATP-binding protein [Bacillus cereus group s
MNNILEIEGLTFRYEDRNVLENINLQVPKGAFLGLVGPNGSGKSTLLKCLLGVLKPKQGSIRLFGVDSKKFKEWNKLGYVSQKANSFNSGFPATVFEVVSMGLVSKKGLFRFFTKDDKVKVEKAIADVGMSEFQGRNIGELSGGQQQRVFIARALVSDPELLILDEPTVGIDVKNVESFYEILEDLNKRLGITLILVTHDMGAVTEKVTHVACLNQHLHFHGNVKEFRELEDAEMSVLYGHHVHRLKHEHEHHGRI